MADGNVKIMRTPLPPASQHRQFKNASLELACAGSEAEFEACLVRILEWRAAEIEDSAVEQASAERSGNAPSKSAPGSAPQN